MGGYSYGLGVEAAMVGLEVNSEARRRQILRNMFLEMSKDRLIVFMILHLG